MTAVLEAFSAGEVVEVIFSIGYMESVVQLLCVSLSNQMFV